MSVRTRTVLRPKVLKMLAAVVVGLSVGSLLSPDAVLVPYVGPVSGVVVGASGLAVGAALYLWVPARLAPSGCGCAGDCGCS